MLEVVADLVGVSAGAVEQELEAVGVACPPCFGIPKSPVHCRLAAGRCVGPTTRSEPSPVGRHRPHRRAAFGIDSAHVRVKKGANTQVRAPWTKASRPRQRDERPLQPCAAEEEPRGMLWCLRLDVPFPLCRVTPTRPGPVEGRCGPFRVIAGCQAQMRQSRAAWLFLLRAGVGRPRLLYCSIIAPGDTLTFEAATGKRHQCRP